MKISEIYKKYSVAPNLARHMMTVAKIVVYLGDHWNSSEAEIDWVILTKSALVHDLGNIVKFDLEKHPEILRNAGEDIEQWKKIQTEMIKKYGRDDHVATETMLNELKIEKRIAEIVLNKTFGKARETAAGNDWHAKILLYSDMRVAPTGIVSLEDRLEDARKRLTHYSKRSDFPELMEATRTIEKQIQGKVDISLSKISSIDVGDIAKDFQEIDV